MLRLPSPLPAAALVATLIFACASLPGRGGAERELWGFTAFWDPRSAESLERNRGRFDVLVTGWIALDTLDGRARLDLFRDTLARRDDPATRYFALVTSWLGDRFHPSTVRRLAADGAALARTAGAIARHAREQGYEGLVLDFEQHERRDLEALMRVSRAIADSARAAGVREIAMAIPATDTVGYPARPLLTIVDHLIIMLYDEHWSTSSPGPIASPDWVRRSLGMRVAEAGSSRVTAALPLYGYQWRPNLPAESINFDQARRAAAGAGVPLERDPATATLRARAADWEIWVADATLIERLMRDVDALGVRRYAFWYVGAEDEEMWDRVGGVIRD